MQQGGRKNCQPPPPPSSKISYSDKCEADVKVAMKGQQVEEWKKEVRACLESPIVKLRSYGGGDRLNIVGQMRAHLS